MAQPLRITAIDLLCSGFRPTAGEEPVRSSTKPRGIGEEHVAKGAGIVGAAKVVEQVVAGGQDRFVRVTQTVRAV